jgi:TonB family protein
MHRRLLFATFLLLAAAPRGAACSGRTWDPNELVENESASSANGRFVAVIRRYAAVPDFTSERAGKVFRMDPEYEDAPLPPLQKTFTVALYESGVQGRRRIAEIPILVDEIDQVLVPDSGRYLVAVRNLRHGGGCSSWGTPADPFVSVFRIDGTRVGALSAGDIITPSDIQQMNFSSAYGPVSLGLKRESDAREVVVVSIPAPSRDGKSLRSEERRIDLATVALLDEKRSVLPGPRTWATAAGPFRQRPFASASADCAAAAEGAKPIDSERLLAAALDAPPPVFPEVAIKARIRGLVTVEVLVSERGEVVCARPTPLPFGIDSAAVEAARHWTFRPFRVDGQPVKVTGEILFHFQDVDEETFRALPRIGW